MRKSTGFYPKVNVDVRRVGAVGQAGGVLLTETIRATGLDRGLRDGLDPWVKPFAVHHPAKILLDLAITLVLGGDCVSDLVTVRGEPGLYGKVASDPTVSRLIHLLGSDHGKTLRVINKARSQARVQAWRLAGNQAPIGVDERRPVIIDVDATLVRSHSEKEHAMPTFKKGFGFHPLTVFLDHGTNGTGEPLSFMLRAGNAGSNTVADHVQVLTQALHQLPPHMRRTKKTLIRADGAGGTKGLIEWCSKHRLGYSVGFQLPDNTPELIRILDHHDAWTVAYTAEGEPRENAYVAELTGLLNLTGYPKGMRVIICKEHPHPGAQLRFDDIDGYRVTAFATNTRIGGPGGQHADLELRHRRRARVEDRIRIAKDTGLANLPFHGFNQNQIWLAIIGLGLDILAWSQTIGFTNHPARRWEPKRLRLHMFTTPAVITRKSRNQILHLGNQNPWSTVIHTAIMRIRGFHIAIE